MSAEKITNEKITPTQLVRRLDVLPNELTSDEILSLDIRGKRWEKIPLAQIKDDTSIIDSGHVEELSNSIFGSDGIGGLGQLTPITAAAFKDEEDKYYLITDGFHRKDVFNRAKEKEIETIVLYGLNLEEVYDLRVLAANSVKSTGFARVVEFMQKSFEQTTWHKDKGLTLLQTFGLCSVDSSGVRLQLDLDEATQLKKWALEKAHCWGKKPGSVYQSLLVASKADPELVKKVRVGSRGRGKGGGDFNTASLKAMTDVIPNRHGLQNAVYEAVIENDLIEEETRRLSEAVKYFDENEEPDIIELTCSKAKAVAEISKNIPDPNEVKDILLVGEYHDLTQEETIQLAEKITQIGENDELRDQMYREPKKFIEIKSEETDEDLKVEKSELATNGHRLHRSIFDKQIYDGEYSSDKTAGYTIPHTNTDLQNQIERLEVELKKAQERAGGNSWKRRKRTWWKSVPGLSIEEVKIYELIFVKRQRLKDVAQSLDMTPNRIAKLIYSGINRYILQERENLVDSITKYIFDDKKAD